MFRDRIRILINIHGVHGRIIGQFMTKKIDITYEEQLTEILNAVSIENTPTTIGLKDATTKVIEYLVTQGKVLRPPMYYMTAQQIFAETRPL